MVESRLYAVVDLETTGASVEAGGRIIQFACTLIEKEKIVNQFSTYVNPETTIPEMITHLTGIQQKDVLDAPFFDEIADTVYRLLEGCIFVAHNVSFDFNFLNQEFVRIGFPELRLTCIDTVELAQILLPTEASFRLSDLAESLDLSHENPHQADSDALVTAELFLKLREKAASLPLVTIEKIVEFSAALVMETGQFFSDIEGEMKQLIAPLDPDILVKNGLAIRKKEHYLTGNNHWEKEKYPLKLSEKNALFNGVIDAREAQNQMMDQIYSDFTSKESHHLAVEAATGVGKSLGYLFPAAYVASYNNKPVVVSTYTTLLQHQLLEKDSILLQQILPFEVNIALVKGKSHYLHLGKFELELYTISENKNDNLLKMRLLVWLTETLTGDLDELNLSQRRGPFWQKIVHNGWFVNQDKDEWLEEDFYLFAKEKAGRADIILTNHAVLTRTLLNHEPMLPDFDHLVVDEAHHLSEMAVLQLNQEISYRRFKLYFQAIGNLEDEASLITKLKNISMQQELQNRFAFVDLDIHLLFLEEKLNHLFDQLLEFFRPIMHQKGQQEEFFEWFLKESFSSEILRQAAKIQELMTEGEQLLSDILGSFKNEAEKLTIAETYLVEELVQQHQLFVKTRLLFKRIFSKLEPGEMVTFRSHPRNLKAHFAISLKSVDVSEPLREQMVHQINHIIYTGATLSLDHDFTFFKQQVGESADLKTLILKSEFDFGTQAKLFVPKEVQSLKELTQAEYVAEMAYYIASYAVATNKNMMVLFNSLEVLKEVYQQLSKNHDLAGREILAQGISGSKERILKRFSHQQGSLLLGGESFWEGVDLVGEALELLVIVRLPFESPAQSVVKARYAALEELGENPFQVDALPRATLKLRQGLGRLIRSKTDKGILIVLDKRLYTTAYGKKMRANLPESLPQKRVENQEIIAEIQSFFKEKLNDSQ